MYWRVQDRISVSLAVTALWVSAATGGIVNELWHRTVDFTDRNDYGYECAIDSQGCVILAGQNHRGPTGSSDGRNAFVVKYDTSGNMLWSNEVGNTTADFGPDVFYSVRVDADDDVYAAGQLGGSNYSQPHTLCLVNKFTSSGTLAWQRSYAVYGWAENMGLAIDPSGSPIAVGREFMNWSASQGDWVIQKYDDNGNQQSGYPFYYNHSYGLADRAQAAAVWTNGSFAVVGFCGVSSGNNDWHVRHYNAARGLIWSDTLDSGGGNDNATSVNYDSTGNLIVGGYTKNPSGTDSDWRIIKYRASDGLRLWNMTYESNPGAGEGVGHLVVDGEDNILAVGSWKRSDGESIRALQRLSGADGNVMEIQTWSDTPGQTLTHVDLRDGMVALSGHVFDGNDWDMFVSLNTFPDYDLPEIRLSDVVASQQPGTKRVDITYDLASSITNTFNIFVTISNAAGPLAATTLTGDVGPGVTTGLARHVVWDGGADQPGAAFSSLWVCVEAEASSTASAVEMVTLPVGVNSGTEPELGAYSVSLAEPLWMDMFEVSKAKWDNVADWAGTNGYDIGVSSGDGKAADHPVYNVDWYACVKWCNARSEKEGLDPCYTLDGNVYRSGQSFPVCDFSASGYRLPSDEEWEYGARGGLAGKRFPWGDTISHTQANYYAGTSVPYDLGPGTGVHPDYDTGVWPNSSPVGSFDSNAYGLYDMAGNMHEWCWAAGTGRKNMRSGSWGSTAYYARCAVAQDQDPDYFYNVIGFRTVRQAQTNRTSVAQCSSIFAADFRDYTLSVESMHGTPAPPVGVHSNYCWRSTANGSVEPFASEEGTTWSCLGWSGTGSVPPVGTTNNTGPFLLTSPLSSITWQWGTPGDLRLAASDFRILDFIGTQTYSPSIGESIQFEITVHNTGDINISDDIVVQVFEGGAPPDLTNYDSNAYVVVASCMITNDIPPGGSEMILRPWTVSGPDRLATLTAVAEIESNRMQSQANAEGTPVPLPVEEFSLLNNGVGRSIEIGSPPDGVSGIDVLTSAPAGMQSGLSYPLAGTACYDWGAREPVLGAFVTVSVNGEDYEDRTASPDGAWNVQLNGLPEGEHVAHIAVDDGHLIGTTNLSLTVDPGPPGVDLRVDWIGYISGTYRTRGQTGYAVTGTPVVLTALIRNDGNTGSGPFEVAFRDPAGSIYCTENAELDAFSWTWVTASTGWVVQADANRLSVIADRSNGISESREDNNTGTASVYGRIPKPDLIVSDVVWSPSNPKSGDAVTLTATVFNQGAVTVPAGTAFETSFTPGGVTNTILSADLDPGDSRLVGGTWTAVTGTYLLTVTTDRDDEIDEDFEDNNVHFETLTVRDALSDLRPFYYLYGYESPGNYRSGLSFDPAEPVSGQPVTVTCDIYNNGTVPLAAGSTFDVVLSADGTPFATNGVILASDLAPDGKVSASAVWTAAGEGPVVFSASVDVSGEVDEENESNNDTTAELIVAPDEALLIPVGLEFLPLQPLPGAGVTLTATVQNNGGVPGGSGSFVEFYAGTTNLADRIGQVDLTTDLDPLGGTGTVSLAWTAPGTAGDVAISARLGESAFERILTVTSDPAPNLQVFSEDISVSPSVPHSGESVTVQAGIRNTEGNPATNFFVQFYVDSAAGAWVELGAPVGVTNLSVGAGATVTAPATILAERSAYAIRVQILPNVSQGDADPGDNIATTSFLLYGTPAADAGPDRNCIAGQSVMLDGSASSNALTYAWTLLSKPVGSDATLTDVDTATPSLAPDEAGNYIAQLIVGKGAELSQPDTVAVTAEWLTLQIESAHGIPDPAVGTTDCAWEQNMECRVSDADTMGTTQYVCPGWVGTGSAPVSGDTTNVIFSITNNSSVIWQWNTNYWLAVAVVNSGSVDIAATPPWSAPAQAGSFEPSGEILSLTAVPAAHYHFLLWTGDTNAIAAGGISNENVTVGMDGPVALTANFALDTYPVVFDVGVRGMRTGGGETNQIVAHGNAATAPVVTSDPGWSFEGWDANFSSVTGPLTVHAQYTQIEHTLTVASGHDTPIPGVGTHIYYWGETVDGFVKDIETLGTTQYVSKGWVGTGSVPASGSTTNVTFVITNDSSIAWLWQTNYVLHVGIADGEGATSVTSGWYAAGMNAEVEAFASEGYRFDAWTVDGESPPYGGTTSTGRWLQVPMDAAHTAAVTFVMLDLPEALDNWNLTWMTGGDTNWFPQVEESSDGIDAAASAEIADGSECWIQTSVTNSGTLRFDWRVSCQDRYDALLFYVDGVPESRLSGESGWEGFSIIVGPGEHTFRWIYRKGASGAAGEDRAWLDCVSWIPGVPEATWTLTVESADDGGIPVPDVGQHTYTNGERVAASVISPHGVVSNAQRSVCTGWTCAGLAPFAGTGTNVMLTMTSDAHLTWLWNTQYRLDTETGNGGSVDVDDGWFDAGTNVTVRATPAAGYAFSHWMGELTGALLDGASVTVTMDGARNLTACFIDLAAALDTTNLVWSVSGDADWLPQTDCTSDGEDAGVSGLIDDFGWSRVHTEVRGPGLLTFNWRVSCEEGYDWFDFLVDGNLSDMLTGESDWQTVTLRIDSGTHQLAWEYWKNEVFSNGEDRAWLDQVRWSPFTGFTLWADERGLSGEMELLFANDYNDNAIPDGFEYAFGTNLVEGTSLINLRVVDGMPLVGIPLRDAATLPYADSRLKGCTNLPGCHAGWTLSLTTTNAPPDDPENREWYRPQGEIPPAAFFILEAELK